MTSNNPIGSKSNDLYDFMIAVTRYMSDEYERIQKRACEDPGTAGDQGEENWATLLRDWLPPPYPVVTKGRILSYDGVPSPQVDVLILRPSYPRALLDKKLYLAGGVAAAFECKVTLKAEHVSKAVESAAEIRRHLPTRLGTPYRELQSPVVYGLLAHSHVWTGEKSTPTENVQRHLHLADEKFIRHPREMPDLLCVADLGSWLAQKFTYHAPVQIEELGLSIPGAAFTGYSGHSYVLKSNPQTPEFTPIGAMLFYLLNALAWEDPSIRALADYFRLANLRGSGEGNLRRWELNIYSDQVRESITERENHIVEPWNEWAYELCKLWIVA